MPQIPSSQGSPQASNIAVQGALPLIGTPSRENGQSVLNSIDASLAKLYEDRNVLLAGGGNITFTGTQLQFTEDLFIHINSQVGGGTPTVINLGAATLDLSANNRMAYAVIDRDLGTGTITDDSATLPAVLAANVEVFLIAKRIDNADATKRVYFLDGSTIGEGGTSKLYAGGSGSSTLIVKDEGTNVDTAVTTLNFTGAGVTVTNPSAGVVDINISGGGSGGGGGGGSPEDLLTREEAGQLPTQIPNTIIDPFNNEVGDNSNRTNTEEVQSALRLVVGQTTGYKEYEFETSTNPIANVDGRIRAVIPAYAPIAEAISGNLIKISGNVTNIFSTASKIIIAKQIDQLGRDNYIHLIDTDNKPAVLALSNVTYNSGTGNTELTVTNPNSLDLDMGISAANIPEQLRVFPYSLTVEASGNGLANLEELELDDAHAIDTVSIPGENTLRQIGSLSGSIQRTDYARSPNGQYFVIRALEKTSGNSLFHWFYSVDRGQTWTKFPTTKSNNIDQGDELGDNLHNLHSGQIVVSNNGKMFSTYSFFNTVYEIRGVYADLTAMTPTLTDTADHGAGAGIIHQYGAFDKTAQVAADLTDLSFIAVLSKQASSENFRIRWFSNGGATNLGALTSDVTHNPSTSIAGFWISGTSPNRRTHVVYRNSATSILYNRYTEGNYSTATVSGTTVHSGNRTIIGFGSNSDYGLILFRDSSNLPYFRHINNSSESISSEFSLSSLATDLFTGTGTEGDKTLHKVINGRVKFRTNTHAFICLDMVHPDGVRRPHIFEVQDITSYQGEHLTHTSVAAPTETFRTNSSEQQKSMTFLANANRVRSITVRLNSNGIIGPGYEMQMKLYAVTPNNNTGLPTGAVLYVSNNKIDPNLLTKSSSGQDVTFNFDNVSLTNGSYYAYVLEGTQPIDATNFVKVFGGISSYADGSGGNYNGTSWSGSTFDAYFRISGDYNREIGNAESSSNSVSGVTLDNSESQIEIIDSNQIQFITRKELRPLNADSWKPSTGHPYRRVINLSNTLGTQSTYTNLVQAAYKDFDPYLIYNVSHGGDDSNRINMTTGALEASGVEGEDRSGWNHTLSAGSTPTRTTNASFLSGFCTDFNGSSHYRAYTDMHGFDLYSSRAFAIEVEVLPDVVTGGVMISHYEVGGGNTRGWEFKFLPGGAIRFLAANTSGTTLADAQTNTGFATVSTYQIYRVIYLGNNTAPKIYKSSSPTGTFTEATYASTTAFVSGNTASAAELVVGARGGSSKSEFYDGKIGYTKFINGSSTFVYNGFKNQAPVTQIQNLGSSVVGEQQIGQNRSTQDTLGNYDRLAQSRQDRSLVDTLDQYFVYKKTGMTNTGNKPALKVTLNRVSNDDQKRLPGLIMKWEK